MTACISSFLELQGSELSERQRHHEAVNRDHQHAEKENKTRGFQTLARDGSRIYFKNDISYCENDSFF